MSCSFTRWLCSLPASVLRMCTHAHFLFLFGAILNCHRILLRELILYFMLDKHFGVHVDILVSWHLEFKGQRRGSYGHIMAGFDVDDKCARCRDKKIGEDNVFKVRSVVFVMVFWKLRKKLSQHLPSKFARTVKLYFLSHLRKLWL